MIFTTTDPKNQTVGFAYDDTLRTFTLTDARGKATVFQADVRGLRTSKIYPGGTHEDSTYDAVGNLAAFTSTAGNTLSITYDPRNRATLRDWSGATPDVSATYDARGLVQTLTNANAALTFTYDNARQLLSESQDLNAPVNLPAKTVSYTYDADGSRASLTYPGGSVIGYGYTARNQMSAVSVGGAALAGFGYAADGRRTGRTRLRDDRKPPANFPQASGLDKDRFSTACGIMGFSPHIHMGFSPGGRDALWR